MSKSLKKEMQWWLSSQYEQERLARYETVMQEQQLSSLAQAKWFLLREVWSPLLTSIIDQAQQEAQEGETQRAVAEIERILPLQEVFKSYDIGSFEKLVLDGVEGITPNEVRRILEEQKWTLNDVKTLNSALLGLQPKQGKEHISALDIMSHPLMKLMQGLRSGREQGKGKQEKGLYEELAQVMEEHHVRLHEEKASGLLLYLIQKDLTTGLGQEPSETKLGQLLGQIKNKKFGAKEFDELVALSITESQNFKNQFNQLTNLRLDTNSVVASGICDRRYGNVHVHDAGKMQVGQGDQRVRGVEVAQKAGYLDSLVVMQVCTRNPLETQMAAQAMSAEQKMLLNQWHCITPMMLGLHKMEQAGKGGNYNPTVQTLNWISEESELCEHVHQKLAQESDAWKSYGELAQQCCALLDKKLAWDSVSPLWSDRQDYLWHQQISQPLAQCARLCAQRRDDPQYEMLGGMLKTVLQKCTEHHQKHYEFSDIESLMSAQQYVATFDALDTQYNAFWMQNSMAGTADRLVGKSAHECANFLNENAKALTIQNITEREWEWLSTLSDEDKALLVSPLKAISVRELKTMTPPRMSAQKTESLVKELIEQPGKGVLNIGPRDTWLMKVYQLDEPESLDRSHWAKKRVQALNVLDRLSQWSGGSVVLTQEAVEKLAKKRLKNG